MLINVIASCMCRSRGFGSKLGLSLHGCFRYRFQPLSVTLNVASNVVSTSEAGRLAFTAVHPSLAGLGSSDARPAGLVRAIRFFEAVLFDLNPEIVIPLQNTKKWQLLAKPRWF